MKTKQMTCCFFFFFLIANFGSLYAINNDKEKSEIQKIKKSKNYYYGEASDLEELEAQKYALQQLVNTISIQISSNYRSEVREKDNNVNRDVKNIIETQAMAKLENFEKIAYQDEVSLERIVFFYIKKSELKKIFKRKQEIIHEFYKKALEWEEEENISGALQAGYNSLILLNSLPSGEEKIKGINMSVEIPSLINRLIKNTTFSVKSIEKIKVKENRLVLDVKYKEKSVSNIEFSYWQNNFQVKSVGTNGTALLTILGDINTISEVVIELKYVYPESRTQNKDIGDVWDLVKKPKFQNIKKLYLTKELRKVNIEDTIEKNNDFSLLKDTKSPKQIKTEDKIKKELENFIKQLSKKSIKDISLANLSDKFIIEKLRSLKKFNKLEILDRNFKNKITKNKEGWEIRGLRSRVVYPNIKTESLEELILDFSKKGKLEDFNFAISENIYTDLKEKSKDIEDWKQKKIILSFIEKYRTAFLSRNINIIKSVFSDNALSIVGRRYKVSNLDKKTKYTKSTGKQYIKRLEKLFRKKKDIAIAFSSLKIQKIEGLEKFYGITMKQEYRTNGYSDKGDLFLLVDFNDENEPKIYVRSWQAQE